MTSMLFGAKSSPCTAMYIKNKNAARFSDRFPATARSIIENCYMDDFLDSCETIQEASQRVRESIEINQAANWEMHGWASNEADVLLNVNTRDSPNQLIKIDDNKNNDEKVLGLKWLNVTDELAFNVNEKRISDDYYGGKKRPTKREFLGIVMSVFDPLGFLTPFTIQSKILMQQIWVSGYIGTSLCVMMSLRAGVVGCVN